MERPAGRCQRITSDQYDQHQMTSLCSDGQLHHAVLHVACLAFLLGTVAHDAYNFPLPAKCAPPPPPKNCRFGCCSTPSIPDPICHWICIAYKLLTFSRRWLREHSYRRRRAGTDRKTASVRPGEWRRCMLDARTACIVHCIATQTVVKQQWNLAIWRHLADDALRAWNYQQPSLIHHSYSDTPQPSSLKSPVYKLAIIAISM